MNVRLAAQVHTSQHALAAAKKENSILIIGFISNTEKWSLIHTEILSNKSYIKRLGVKQVCW